MDHAGTEWQRDGSEYIPRAQVELHRQWDSIADIERKPIKEQFRKNVVFQEMEDFLCFWKQVAN